MSYPRYQHVRSTAPPVRWFLPVDRPHSLPQVLSSPGAPPSLSLLVGSVTHGAYLRSPSHVVHSGMGSIKLAPVDARLPTLTHPDHQKAWDSLQPGSNPTHTAEEEREGRREASPPRKQHHQHPHHHREKGDNAVEAAGDSGDASGSGQAEGAAAAAAVGWDGRGGDGGGLLHQLLAIPSLAAELVPSHASLMRQIHLKVRLQRRGGWVLLRLGQAPGSGASLAERDRAWPGTLAVGSNRLSIVSGPLPSWTWGLPGQQPVDCCRRAKEDFTYSERHI